MTSNIFGRGFNSRRLHQYLLPKPNFLRDSWRGHSLRAVFAGGIRHSDKEKGQREAGLKSNFNSAYLRGG